KIADFGIAKSAGRRRATTSPGLAHGKLRYMAPEQLRAAPVTRRTDVFAAAIVLYELTTGRRLFGELSDFDVMRRIVEGQIAPPSSVVARYPLVLERIVMKALERDPRGRFATCDEMRVALDAFARQAGLDVCKARVRDLMQRLFSEEIAMWNLA